MPPRFHDSYSSAQQKCTRRNKRSGSVPTTSWVLVHQSRFGTPELFPAYSKGSLEVSHTDSFRLVAGTGHKVRQAQPRECYHPADARFWRVHIPVPMGGQRKPCLLYTVQGTKRCQIQLLCFVSFRADIRNLYIVPQKPELCSPMNSVENNRTSPGVTR